MTCPALPGRAAQPGTPPAKAEFSMSSRLNAEFSRAGRVLSVPLCPAAMAQTLRNIVSSGLTNSFGRARLCASLMLPSQGTPGALHTPPSLRVLETASLGNWWSHNPLKSSKNEITHHFVTWFSVGMGVFGQRLGLILEVFSNLIDPMKMVTHPTLSRQPDNPNIYMVISNL